MGARRSSMAEHSVMVRWVVGLIPHGGPIVLFLIPVSASMTGLIKAMISAILLSGMMYIKDPFLIFGTSSRCYGDSAFSLSLSEWSSTLIAISRSSQCSTTGVTKAMVCAILSVGCVECVVK